MKTKSYEFEGETIDMTLDEIKVFSKSFVSGAEYLGSKAQFDLKDNKTIAGTIVKFEYLYPTDFSDFRLTTKFFVETENGYTTELHFTEINSYELKN